MNGVKVTQSIFLGHETEHHKWSELQWNILEGESKRVVS